MKIVEVETFLLTKGLQPPALEVLAPSIDDYNLLLLQPKGVIEACKARVGNHDQAAATTQCMQLLELAAKQKTDLVVTPEYSVPWDALINSIRAGHLPGARCLWAIGCESITPAELDELEGKLDSKARVFFENFDRGAASKKVFLDPLAYIFHSKNDKNEDGLVILIQFKTHPSSDPQRIEGDNLFCGDEVYVFGTIGKTIRLFSLICSDAFVAADPKILKDLYEQTLILHIQLNQDPRQSAYRTYRKYLLDTADDRTEIICLNWASNVQEWDVGAGKPKNWGNISGSAWYLRPDKFDFSDHQINANHGAGLYYTRLTLMKWHVLFFNYCPAAFVLRSSKVYHHDVKKVQSKRSGPRVQDVLSWDENTSKWNSKSVLDDGFDNLLQPRGALVDPLKKLYRQNCIYVERFLALTAGKISEPDNWHSVIELDSFAIDEAEYVKRITFAQDPEPSSVDFRRLRVTNFVTYRQILDQFNDWPPELSDLKDGHDFTWDEKYPHSNVVSKSGHHITLIYLGEDRLDDELKAIGDKLRTALHRQGQPKERLGLFHRRNGLPMLWLHPDSKRFDKPGNTSPVDFTGG